MFSLYLIFVLVFCVVSVQGASPTPTSRPNKNGWPWYICGGSRNYATGQSGNDGIASYSQSEITRAVLQGYELLLDQRTVAGEDSGAGRKQLYPKRLLSPNQFSNIDNRWLNRPEGLYEFPIVKGSTEFHPGDAQGPDRVIFDPVGGNFVAVLTHRGARPFINEFFPCNGHSGPVGGSGGGSGITGAIPVPMIGGALWAGSGDLPFKRDMMHDRETEFLENTATQTSSLEPFFEFLYWDALQADSCNPPDFCSDCNGTNMLYNDTFGICQLGNCTGYLCPNDPIPNEYTTTLPCNSTECYGMVANSTSTDGYCLFGNLNGFSCTPLCPPDDLSCSDCKGTLDNTGTGVCGDPFYAGCPCKGDCPSNITCDDDTCVGYNNLGVCNGGSLRGCPCTSVCGPEFACNLNDCQGFNINGTLGTCTNGDFIGCGCTPTCSDEILPCGNIANCTGIAIGELAYCTQGDNAGCSCSMSCSVDILCSESDCGGVNNFCQEEEYFGCNCISWNSSTTAAPTATTSLTAPTPTVTATCTEWNDCPANFCLDGASVECESGYCTCATE